MYFNIAFSLGCKAVQVFCSLWVVRHLVGMLGVGSYGTWVTMTSVLSWITLFDLGVGYGLKNRISEAYATNKMAALTATASAVASFYLLTAIVVFLIFLAISLCVEPFSSNLAASILLVSCTASAFFFSFGSVVLQGVGAFRQFYLASLVSSIGWLLFIFAADAKPLNIFMAAIAYSTFILAQAILTFQLGKKHISELSISFASLRSPDLRKILRSSIGFFLLQISSLALFLSGNFIAYQNLGAKDTATYDTLYKIFQLFSVGFSILITISWTEISKAKAKRDARKKILILKCLVSTSVMASMIAFAIVCYIGPITELLTNGKITASFKDAIAFVPLVLIQSLAYSGAVYLNAYEKLKPQITLSLFSIPIFFGLVFWFFHLGMNVVALPLACAAAILPSMIYCLASSIKLARLV